MLNILFEDYHCIVVNKPAPLLTQAPPGIDSLESQVKEYIREKFSKPAGVYLGVPHRLDRPVSGAIVFARNSKAARRLAEQFQKHEVGKAYWAIVEGQVTPLEGTLEDWLLKQSAEARTEIVHAGTSGAKRAVLSYCVLRSVDVGSLVEIRPTTGRAHQLRVQFASRGWPIWGDAAYGSKASFGPSVDFPRERVIALHARQLTFHHPTTREAITVTAPLPDYWPATTQ
jgi:23S rRNA pseudouridine1911/1915/1917 synthase